jgi:hypothetical protein
MALAATALQAVHGPLIVRRAGAAFGDWLIVFGRGHFFELLGRFHEEEALA